MQLASYGTRAVGARSLGKAIGWIKPQAGGSNSITRNIISRFWVHLSTPGLSVPRSLHSQASHATRLSSRVSNNHLSLPARHALSLAKSPRAYIPRGPVVAARGVGEVGLGTARNFSSGRMLFANVVENVPIAGRAAYEVDWKVQKERQQSRKMRMKKDKQAKRERVSVPKITTQTYGNEADEMDKFFASASSSSSPFVTALLVPLSPPRRALGQSDSIDELSDSSRLLHLPSLSRTHSLHTTHRLRVSTLFARLDAAHVWDSPGVSCHPFTEEDEGPGNAQVTHLEVTFRGWNERQVRNVIGESGLGWCKLVERPIPAEESDLSTFGSPISGSMDLNSMSDIHEDPSETLVLPTLDIMSNSNSTQTEERWFSSEFDSDGSDFGSDGHIVSPQAAPVRLGFSARFYSESSRSDDEWTSAGMMSDFE